MLLLNSIKQKSVNFPVCILFFTVCYLVSENLMLSPKSCVVVG